MLKEFAQYLVRLGTPDLFEVNDQQYSSQSLHLLEQPTPATVGVRSLSGLVEYIQSEFDGSYPLMIHVESPTRVKVFSRTNEDQQRMQVIQAEAMIPDFTFDRFYDPEKFNIKLQSCFIPNEDLSIMLKVVGNLKEEDVRSVGDDGTSQAVSVRTGVVSVGDVKVPNPVELAPRRTFVEIQQPESDFVFRMQTGPTCGLFEADGGAWKLAAMKSIKEYLSSELSGEIDSKRIHIIA